MLSVLPTVGIIGIVAAQFYLASASGVAAIYAQSALQLQLSRVMHDLMTDIREASDVQAAGTVSTFNGAYTCDADTLCLSWPSVSALGVPVNDVLVYDFVPATGRMTRVLSAVGVTRTNTQRIEASSLTLVNFTLVTTGTAPNRRGSVRCELRASQAAYGRMYMHTLASQARLRNYQ